MTQTERVLDYLQQFGSITAKAGLRRMSKLTRFCPRCGAELLWEQDDMGLYVAMDYDSDPHKPHILTCPGAGEFRRKK